jgi:hypothetical protein
MVCTQGTRFVLETYNYKLLRSTNSTQRVKIQLHLHLRVIKYSHTHAPSHFFFLPTINTIHTHAISTDLTVMRRLLWKLTMIETTVGCAKLMRVH